MAKIINDFDEIHKLVGYKRSEPYEKYFSVMKIPKSGIRNRIELAKILEDKFMDVFLIMLTMQDIGYVDYTYVRTSLVQAYMDALSDVGIERDEAIILAIGAFADEFVKATQKHESDPYYYSKDRLRFISENESNTTYNGKDYNDAVDEGCSYKTWVTEGDNRVRPTHQEASLQTVKIDEPFSVGDSLLMYPKDTSLGADSSEIVNCRCWVEYK